MNIYLLTRSSFSHDISNFLFLRSFSFGPGRNIFFVLSFSRDKLCNQFEYFKDDYQSLLPSSSFYFFLGSTYLRRFILFVIILVSYFLSIFRIFKLVLIHPSPAWLYHRFGFLSILLPRLNSILVGDGVGSETLSSTPFWLSHIYSPQRSSLIKASYFVFSLESSLSTHHISRHQYHSSLLSRTFSQSHRHLVSTYLDPLLFPILESSPDKPLLLFAPSTFFEYSRMSLDNEISLYKQSLSSILNNFQPGPLPHILIKPHPLTHPDKIYAMCNLLATTYSNFDEYKIPSILRSLMSIPLELLITYFYQRGFGSDLTIVSASAASLPSVLAYPKVKHVLLFGPILSKKHFIDETHFHNRVSQEYCISNFLSSLS